MAHAAGALVLVDGAQAVPHVPVDVQELGADFYAFSGHKMLAPMGSGALWARRELLEAMPPFLAGGEMIREVHLRRSDFNDIPWKFEAGTPAVGDAIGLGVAAEYLRRDRDGRRPRARARARRRTPSTRCRRAVPGIELYGPLDPDLRGGVVPFNLPGIHPHDVAQVLDRFGIAVRAGHHCTMPLHERLDLAATARACFSVYSTRDDIDALADGLLEVQRVFGRVGPGPGQAGPPVSACFVRFPRAAGGHSQFAGRVDFEDSEIDGAVAMAPISDDGRDRTRRQAYGEGGFRSASRGGVSAPVEQRPCPSGSGSSSVTGNGALAWQSWAPGSFRIQ